MLKKILLSFAILSTQSIANNDDVIKNLFPIFGNINQQDVYMNDVFFVFGFKDNFVFVVNGIY
jgi:hypothetical protein